MAYFSNAGPNTQVFPNAPGAMPGAPMGAGGGSAMPATVGTPGRSAMWAGGGMGPGFPTSPAPQGVPGAPAGAPLGLTPEMLLKMIQAKQQFRAGPEDSIIPTGAGSSEFANLKSGGY